MTFRNFLLRFAGLAAITFGGGIAYAVTFNALVLMGLTPDPDVAGNFGNVLTLRTVFVMMAAIVAGFTGLFLRGPLRWPLYLSPLYAPSLFAVLYTVLQT